MDGHLHLHCILNKACSTTSQVVLWPRTVYLWRYRNRPGMVPYSFRRSLWHFSVQTGLFVCSTRNHQLNVTFEPRSNYGKVPYPRAQHVGNSGARTSNLMITRLYLSPLRHTCPYDDFVTVYKWPSLCWTGDGVLDGVLLAPWWENQGNDCTDVTTANGDLMNCIIMGVLETNELHTIARVSPWRSWS